MERIKGKIPKRRFEGFTDDWEQRKLLGCIQKITDFRGRTPKKLGMDWSESGYLALSALNVKDGYIDFMQDVHYGNQELYDKWMTGNELHKGQVLFTTEAPMGNVAQVPDNRQYILSQRTIAFDVKDDYITENFLATVLRTPKVFEDLTALSSGGTAKGVSQKSLAAVDIIIPTDLKEQEYIARYFANLNNLITLHQRKLEKLKNIKKSYLSEMFPQEDEKKPKRRFKGFTDDWEQRKLSEVAEFSKGNGYSKGDLCGTGTPIILYGRLYTKYETTIKEVDTFVIPKEGSVYSKGGEVIVPASGETAEDIARAATVENAGILLGGDLNVVTPNKDINSTFLALSISNGGPRKELAKKAQGKSVVHVHNEEIKGLDIAFPERAEQDKISAYFSKLDYLITLHQRKLEKLKHIKQAYLNEMFV